MANVGTRAPEADVDDASADGDESGADDAAEVVDPVLPDSADDLPPLDFGTFVVSLRTSAIAHLEDASHDRTNLALARQEIDLLVLLEEKTSGNLTGDEERLLSQILFDLRTRYIALRSPPSRS